MAEDLGRLTLTTELIDQASGPLQKLKRVATDALDGIAAATVTTVGAVGKGAGGIAGALTTAGGGVMKAAQVIGGGIAGIGRAFGNMATSAINAAGIAAGALLTTGIIKAQEVVTKGYQRVITMQDATAQSAVLMGGDVAKATAFMEQIREVVTGTPFTLPDFAKAGQQMLMYGIGAEKIPGILTAVGEATAGQGARATEMAARMSDVIAKMAATGQVQLGDMWSMAEAGVPALNILANGFNVTTEDMKDMISKGLVPAKESIDILTKGIMEGSNGAAGATAAYAGSMQKLGETWSGSLAIFEASKAILGAKFIDPLKEEMPGILITMKEINVALGGFAPMWVNWLDSSGVLGWIKTQLEGVRDAITNMANGGLTQMVDKIGPFVPLIGALAGYFAAMSMTSLAGLLGPLGALLPTINPLVAAVALLVALSPELRDLFVGAFKQLMELLKPLMPMFQELGKLLGSVFNQVMAQLVGVVQQLLAAVVPIIPVFLQLTMILIEALAPILPILIAFLGQVAAIIVGALAEAIIRLVPPLVGFINQLIERLSPILPVIFSALVQLLEIFTPLIPIIVEIAIVVLNLATQFIQSLLPPLLELIPTFLDLAKTLGGAVMTILLAIMPPLADLLMALMPIIPPVIELIALFLKLAMDILTPLMPIITEVARVVADVLALAIKDAIPFVKDLIQFVVDLADKLTKTLQPILSTIGGMFRAIGGFVGDVVRGIGDFIKAGWEKVTGFIKFITGQASGGGIAKAMGGGIAMSVRHFADGGIVGGYAPGKDTVPAMLSPGEAVLVPELVRALGARNIMAANFAYSNGRPAMAGSPDRTGGGNPFGGGGGTTIIITLEPGAISVTGSGPVDVDDIERGLTKALENAARRAY